MRVQADDLKRLDLVVPRTGIVKNLSLLYDVTCVSPVTGTGLARPRRLTINDGAVEAATKECRGDYPEILESSTALLFSLGVEVYGR